MKKIKIIVLVCTLIFCSCLVNKKRIFVAPTTESLPHSGEKLVKFIAGSLANEVSLNSPLALLDSEKINISSTATTELQKQIFSNFENMLKKYYKIEKKESNWDIIVEFTESKESLEILLMFSDKTGKKQEIKRKFLIK